MTVVVYLVLLLTVGFFSEALSGFASIVIESGVTTTSLLKTKNSDDLELTLYSLLHSDDDYCICHYPRDTGLIFGDFLFGHWLLIDKVIEGSVCKHCLRLEFPRPTKVHAGELSAASPIGRST